MAERGWEPALAVLVGLFPVAAVFVWVRIALQEIDRIEQEIRPLGGLAYATFVQLAYSWGTGHGWVQTVHRGYAEDWRWGGHYAPVLFASSWLASLSDSPWALARVQAVAVGVGGLAAWRLGRAEAGLLGGAAGLAIYLGSGPVFLLALADYQDLVFLVPAMPLLVWAARHASWPVFLLVSALFCTVREEALLLLPVAALTAGAPRAVLASAVSATWILYYRSLGPSPYPNPLADILLFQVHRAQEAGTGAFVAWSPNLYGAMAGAGWPWLVLAPFTALPGVAVALFHAQDPTSVAAVGSPAIHHLAPLAAASISAGIVGACRVLRLGRVGLLVGVVGVALTTGASVRAWSGPLDAYAFRSTGVGTHPAWALLESVDLQAAILVPEGVAPAAARRLRVVTADSLGDRVRPSEVTIALDDGRLTGTVVSEQGGWRILREPVLPNVRDHGAPGATGRQ
jgi:hypothetical protein